MIVGVERRIRAAEGLLDGAAPARTEADDRLDAALAEVPRPVLHRMLTLADADDDEAAAMLEADTELVVWLEELMGREDA